jgi:alkaline phosphatase
VIEAAVATGYTYVNTWEAMRTAVRRGAGKLLGLFATKNLTPEYLRPAETTEPRLPEMTAAALSLLEKNDNGFFLMVEGSLIDSGNHAENLDYMLGEMEAFDESVKTVLHWIRAREERRNGTLLIVAADHETGGFAVMAPETPKAGLGPFTAGWTFMLKPGDPKDFEAHHTGGDVMIWSQGPGSEELGRPIDNTDVYRVVKEALKM